MATFTGHDIQEAAKGTFCPLLCCDLWSSLGWMGSNAVGVVVSSEVYLWHHGADFHQYGPLGISSGCWKSTTIWGARLAARDVMLSCEDPCFEADVSAKELCNLAVTDWFDTVNNIIVIIFVVELWTQFDGWQVDTVVTCTVNSTNLECLDMPKMFTILL